MFPFAEIVICISVWIFFGPFLIIFTLANEVYRIFVKISLWGSRFTLRTDGVLIFLSNRIATTPNCLMILFSMEEQLDTDKEIELFNTRVFTKREGNGEQTYKLFKKTFTTSYGYCAIRDDSEIFDIRNHIKLHNDCAEIIQEDDLHKKIVPQLLKEQFDGSTPQWELLLFPRILRRDATIQSARILRWHHGYMDGAATGMFFAETMFDQTFYEGGKVPYIINPKVPTTSHLHRLLAKAWAIFHLPLIVLLELIAALTKKGKAKLPFASNSFEKTCLNSRCESIPSGILREGINRQNSKVGRNSGVISILTTAMGRPLARIWRDMHPDAKIEKNTFIPVESPVALLPYPDSKPRNRFSLIEFKVPLDGSRKWVKPELDCTIYYARIYASSWLGRLPLKLAHFFVGAGQTTTEFNYMPFLRRRGAIRGNQITQIAAYAMLVNPIGIDITVVGYGDEITVTCSSAEESMSREVLDNFLGYYVNEILELCNDVDDIV